ncbi:Hypothetical protein, putative [Bodo saltans]|uniref:Uncharacterized protein n=1 Tax=Bodo saltans TaxID=75058 RepID=A0A0S4IYS4_BODSA|nr:Hypothetical protein, putative [Bodo saltans]|eukprot:CUG23468.1 Hypothetical protein, putative [Bodo saltans]
MGGTGAAARRHTTTMHGDDHSAAAVVPLPQFQTPMSPSGGGDLRGGGVQTSSFTVATQTCASLASVGLLSEETQTEDDGLGFQRSFNGEFGNMWSGAPSPKAKGYKNNNSYLSAPHGGRSSATPTPSAIAVDAEGALMNLMSDHHEQQRDRILMADLVVREAKLQQALHKMRIDHDKELSKEQDTSNRMEALASKNGDLLRAERLHHEVAMNDMRLALENSKKMIEALQQQLTNSQDEAQQLKHVITLQEEASVRAAKDQSRKIVEAMEKHLVRQHDESEQRNANRVADEQRRYQERREEWLRTMRKEGASSPQQPLDVPSSPNLGSTSTLGSGGGDGGSVPPGEAVIQSRSRNSSISTNGSASPLRLDAQEIRSPRQALLQSSESSLPDQHGVRRTSIAMTSHQQHAPSNAGLSPMSSATPRGGLSVAQLQQQLSPQQPTTAADRRKSSVHGSSSFVGRVVATAVNVRKATKRLSNVLSTTSPSRRSTIAGKVVLPTSEDDTKEVSSARDAVAPQVSTVPTESLLLLSSPFTGPAARRSTVAPTTTFMLQAPTIMTGGTSSSALPLNEVDEAAIIAARCLQGGEEDAASPPAASAVHMIVVPPHHTTAHHFSAKPAGRSSSTITLLSAPEESNEPVSVPQVNSTDTAAAGIFASAASEGGDASFLAPPKRGQRNMSLFSGDALHIMKEDMLSNSISSIHSSSGGGKQRNLRKGGTDSTTPPVTPLETTHNNGNGSASTAQRQNWARRREQATKQLESALGDVERLTRLLKERSAADTMVDAEQRLQQCSDALKAYYETQYTSAMEALKKREREIADLFTAKAASLEAELNATSATVHSLHVKVETLERENANLTIRIKRAESTKDSSEKLEVLQRALLSVGQDHLCCLCRDNVLRDEVNRSCTATAYAANNSTTTNVSTTTGSIASTRGSLQVRPAHLLPHSPSSVDKSARLSIAASGGPLVHHRHSSGGSLRRPQTAGQVPIARQQGESENAAADLDAMPGSAMAVISLPMSSSLNTPMTSQLMPPSLHRSPTHVQQHHGGGAGNNVLINALQNSQSPYALGFHESVQEQLLTNGPPTTTLRLGPAS